MKLHESHLSDIFCKFNDVALSTIPYISEDREGTAVYTGSLQQKCKRHKSRIQTVVHYNGRDADIGTKYYTAFKADIVSC